MDYKGIIHLIEGEKRYKFVLIKLKSGEIIEATPDHPFYANLSWKQAGELKVGDKLFLANGTSSVKRISREVRAEKVYNFAVEKLHTYFVGDDGVLVHNKNKNKSCKFRGVKAKGFKWDDILRKHSPKGRTHLQRTRQNHTYFKNLTDAKIKSRVKAAWKNRELRKTQTSISKITGKEEVRMYYEGIDPKSDQKVGMYFNRITQTVETAFPVN